MRTLSVAVFFILFWSFSVQALDVNEFRRLRNQGIKNIGWVWGNVSSHPVADQMSAIVGPNGRYYDVLVGLGVPGEPVEFEAAGNVSLYRNWVGKGEKLVFDEPACIAKIQRAQQIIRQLGDMIAK